MFILEKLKSDYDARVKKWEHDRDEWVAAGDDRYHSEYAERHPRPGSIAKKLIKSAILGLCIGLSISIIALTVKEVEADMDKNDSAAQSVSGKNCKKFNKNDYVRIQYGNYEGNQGLIVGGCSDDEDYQVKIDEGSEDVFGKDVGDNTISVNSYKNLVVLKESKE